jgi:chemotaxis protein CheD
MELIPVGVGQMRCSSRAGDVLVTYALGSCLGITAYDPQKAVGAMVHIMLPSASINPTDGELNPHKYVDTGLQKLFEAVIHRGGDPRRLVLAAAGGSRAQGEGLDDHFQIGKRNIIMLRKVLWENNILLRGSDVGGNQPRTMMLHVDTGEVTVKMGEIVQKLV